MIDTRLVYIRVPLLKLVKDYYKAYMDDSTLIEWTYDARKDEVLIEVMVDKP